MPSNQTVYSYGAYASGDLHHFTRYLGPSGVALHPFQRHGIVSSFAAAMSGRMRARGWPGLGDGPPAGSSDVRYPPLVPIQNGPRSSANMV